MKRSYLFAFVMLMLLGSCSENKDEVSGEKGTLCIASTVEGIELSGTRAEADVNQFTLILENQSNPGVNITGVFSDFPNGTIADIPVGNYQLTLTSHPDGFVPAFNDPWYQGLKSEVPVASGRTTMVTVECIQANAGISFVFDPALEQAGYGDIVPEMTQNGTTLYFDDENREARAYFLPKQVELRIKHGNEYLKIGGKEVQILDLEEQQLWETTLKPSEITGKLSVIATVKVIDKPTHFIEFELEDEDLVDVKGLKINAHTSSFLAKGTGITAMRFGLFNTESVDFMLNIMSPEQFMATNGGDLPAAYLAQLNSAEGLELNFDGMTSLTKHTLMIMSTQDNMRKVQRYDFISAEGIEPDPDQNADGPIVPGTYYLDIFEDIVDGEYVSPYENTVYVTKAIQKNIYIVSGLFMMDNIELIAEYNDKTSRLVFTGQDIMEYDIFNEIAFEVNGGENFAGIYLTDGVNPVDQLVFTVADRKLDKTATAMEFRMFDPWTEQQIDWIEVSPMNNPFRTSRTSAVIDQDKVTPMRNSITRFQPMSTRSASSHAKKNVLRSSVIRLK